MLQRVSLLILLCCSFLYSYSQVETTTQDTTIVSDSTLVAQDSLADDSRLIRSKIDYDFAVYGALAGLAGPNPDGLDGHVRYSGGIVVKKLILEANLTAFQGKYRIPLIFPNDFQINYIHAGMDIGYYFLVEEQYELSILVGYSRGDMLWERSDNFENLFRDEFNVLSAKIRGEGMLIKEARVFAELGYQQMTGLELTQLTSSDFSGLTAAIGIKVGFHKMSRIQ